MPRQQATRTGYGTGQVKVRGGLGTGGKRFVRLSKPVCCSWQDRAPCEICGVQIHFDICKTTTMLLRRNPDGSLHIHEDG